MRAMSFRLDNCAPFWRAALCRDLVRYRLIARGCLLSAISLLYGCYAAHMSVYPSGWPEAKTIPADTCPQIAGRYVNIGIRSSDWDSNMKHFCTGYPTGHGRRPSWVCDMDLWDALVGDPVASSARAIEIRQPDSATLFISVPDDPSFQERTLSRAQGDFACDVSGLTMSITGSDMNAVSTVLSVLVLHFGVASSARSFRPLANGSLLMEVTNTHFVTQEILATGTIKGQGFVRWDRDTGELAGDRLFGAKGSACGSGADCNDGLICATDVCVE